MNAKSTKKSSIHENADANITCDFDDGDISRSRSRLPHTRTDGQTATLVRSLKPTLMQSLTLIINQILTTGIFPDTLKFAKVVHIYKKGEHYPISNYIPIFLLPAIPRIIEKIMYSQLDNFFRTQHTCMTTNTDSERNTPLSCRP